MCGLAAQRAGAATDDANDPQTLVDDAHHD
jgi:hypothetical protein